MIILEKVYRHTTYADERNRRFKARETFTVKRNPHGKKFFINGIEVSPSTCLQPMKKK